MEWGGLSEEKQVPPTTAPILLEYEWALWYDEGAPKGQSHADYENSMKMLGSFATVQDFWRYWNNIVDIDKFPDFSNLRMFKTGIKPMWEDKSNVDGGKWVVQSANKEQTNNLMIKLVLAIIGEQLEYGEDVCGVVLSVRPKGDTINIWNKCGNDAVIISTTTSQLAQIVGEIHIKYQAHREAITYNKTFHSKSPKAVHTPPAYQLMHLKISSEDIGLIPEAIVPNILSASTGALTRGHSNIKASPPFLDLDTESKSKLDVDMPIMDNNKVSDEKDWMELPAMTTEKVLPSQYHRIKIKQHKKSPTRIVELPSMPIIPPLSIISPPIQQVPSLNNSASFRKQHRKSASVSVESPVSSHSKTHSRTPSSDTKHSSRSPLLISSSFNSSSLSSQYNGAPPSRVSKSRISPILLPIDMAKRISRKRNSVDTNTELHNIDMHSGANRSSSSWSRRTSVDECLVDDVVVKELLGGGDEEDFDFQPHAFAPVAHHPPGSKEEQQTKIKRRGRKEHRSQTDRHKKHSSQKIILDLTAFFIEHIHLFGMILAVCLITIAIQRW